MAILLDGAKTIRLHGHSPAVILCVDDQPISLDLRKRVLEQSGYTILSATSARQALEIFRGTHVDLVLTDHMLPLVNGTTLAAEMKRVKPQVPIAILSGVSEVPEDMTSADMFITKLMPIDELLRTIQGLLRNQVQLKRA